MDIRSFFIRPERQTYHLHDLGPSLYFYNGIRIKRVDFTVPNNAGNLLHASFFQNDIENPSSDCVIYLHTHHGSRLEGTPLVNRIIKDGANICLFDFAGYGNSEGANVTMGINEKFDIESIINQLKRRNQKKFILWGRSMGAVTSLLFNQSNLKQVVAAIYDSPFCSLSKLTLQLAQRNSGLPRILIKPVLQLLKLSLICQLDFSQLDLEQKVQNIKIPGYFIVSKKDSFMNSEHTEVLYEQYKGPKQLLFIDQDHNQSRQQRQLNPIFLFIKGQFNKHSRKCSKWGENLMSRERCRTSYSIITGPRMSTTYAQF